MKALKFILFLLGFPVLVALVALASLNVIEQGLSYGFWPFIGLIVALPLTALVSSYYKRYVLRLPSETTSETCEENEKI